MTLYLNRRGQKIKKIILLHNFNQFNKVYEKIIVLPKKRGVRSARSLKHGIGILHDAPLIEALLTSVHVVLSEFIEVKVTLKTYCEGHMTTWSQVKIKKIIL